MPEPTPDEAALVTATADHIQSIVSLLRELDLGETRPDRTGETHAAL
ncbi:hypothetical protein [Amycolatopsis sp. PS_44_ISF1]|nr:hypothetical protein [Amycolatopsis sp. PS_44_ISF1]MDT8913191.1 hypothetical protein [Amycolatopsis sp. PS_44_ISF1]